METFTRQRSQRQLRNGKTGIALATVFLICAPAISLAQDAAAPQQGRRAGGLAGMPRITGEVTGISGATLTLKAEDGTITQVVTTDNTRVEKNSATPADAAYGPPTGRRGDILRPIKLADIHTGDGAMAAGILDAPNKTLHAAFLVVTDASVVRAIRDNLGKTYIRGRVTAVDLDNAKLTLTRPDGVSQTIGFDENTSFHKGGRGMRGQPGGGDAIPVPGAPAAESITLADIKPGDNITGRGSVKNGVFVPSELVVMGQREHGGAQPQQPPSPQQ